MRNGKPDPVPLVVPVKALIDTGAIASAIRPQLVEIWGIQPTGIADVCTATSLRFPCPEFPVRLIIPVSEPEPEYVNLDITVIGAPLPDPDIDCLIGRDILSNCVFIYNGKADNFTLCL